MTLLKRASAVLSTGGVGITTPPAESPSRDFGSTIFNIGEAGDLQSRRPALQCEINFIQMQELYFKLLLYLTMNFLLHHKEQ